MRTFTEGETTYYQLKPDSWQGWLTDTCGEGYGMVRKETQVALPDKRRASAIYSYSWWGFSLSALKVKIDILNLIITCNPYAAFLPPPAPHPKPLCVKKGCVFLVACHTRQAVHPHPPRAGGGQTIHEEN